MSLLFTESFIAYPRWTGGVGNSAGEITVRNNYMLNNSVFGVRHFQSTGSASVIPAITADPLVTDRNVVYPNASSGVSGSAAASLDFHSSPEQRQQPHWLDQLRHRRRRGRRPAGAVRRRGEQPPDRPVGQPPAGCDLDGRARPPMTNGARRRDRAQRPGAHRRGDRGTPDGHRAARHHGPRRRCSG